MGARFCCALLSLRRSSDDNAHFYFKFLSTFWMYGDQVSFMPFRDTIVLSIYKFDAIRSWADWEDCYACAMHQPKWFLGMLIGVVCHCLPLVLRAVPVRSPS